MAVDYTIETYWNVETLYTVLNAVSALMGSGDYSALLKLMFMVGIAAGLFIYMGNKQLEFAKWIISSLAIVTLLNLPIARITLVDKANLEPPKVVSNVPWMMATAAYLSNIVSNFMTVSYENMVLVPDELGLVKGDLAFGHSVLKNVNQASISDPNLKADLMQFFKECTLYDIQDGVVPAKQLVTGTDTWNLIFDNTNPARFVTYDVMSGQPKTDTCTNVAAILKTKVNNGINAAMARYGRQLFPRANSDALAQQMFANAVGASNDYLIKQTASASDSMKQAMFNNIWREAGSEIPVLLNDPARAAQVTALAGAAQAAVKAQGSQNVIALLARDSLPHIRNWIEAILYAVFPFVIILIIISSTENAKKIIIGYFMSFAWIGLWPVMFAIINSLSLMLLQKKIAALNLATLQGIPFQLTNTIDATIIDEQALVGWMVVLVPFLSGALIKLGQMGMTGMADKMFASYGSAGGAVGGDLSSGNLTMGERSIDNVNARNVNSDKYDASSSMMSGAFTLGGSNGTSYTQTPDGTMAYQVMQNSDHFSMARNQEQESSSSTYSNAATTVGSEKSVGSSSGVSSSQLNNASQQASRGTEQGMSTSTEQSTTAGQSKQSSDQTAIGATLSTDRTNTQTHSAVNQLGLNGGAHAGLNGGMSGASGGSSSPIDSKGQNPQGQGATTNTQGGTKGGGRNAGVGAGVTVGANAALYSTTSGEDSGRRSSSNDLHVGSSTNDSNDVTQQQRIGTSGNIASSSSQSQTRTKSSELAQTQSIEQANRATTANTQAMGHSGEVKKSDSSTVSEDMLRNPVITNAAAKHAGMGAIKFASLDNDQKTQIIDNYLNRNGNHAPTMPKQSPTGTSLPTDASMGGAYAGAVQQIPSRQQIIQGANTGMNRVASSQDVAPIAPAFDTGLIQQTAAKVDSASDKTNPESLGNRSAELVKDVHRATDPEVGAGLPNIEASAIRDTATAALFGAMLHGDRAPIPSSPAVIAGNEQATQLPERASNDPQQVDNFGRSSLKPTPPAVIAGSEEATPLPEKTINDPKQVDNFGRSSLLDSSRKARERSLKKKLDQ